MNTRRKLVIAIGAGALAPRTSFAQTPGKVWRVGFLAQRRVDFVESDLYYGPFRQGMRELGYVEGRNLMIEWRSAEGKAERLPELAAELTRLQVEVIATVGTPAAMAAQKATTTIPTVMIAMGDPIGSGLVKSLARPGGNKTGISIMTSELTPKLLEMLRSMVPKVVRVAVLLNPVNASNTVALKNIQIAAQKLGLKVQPVEAGTPEEIANGFSAMTRETAGALIVMRDPIFQQHRNQIAQLAMERRLPSIASSSEYVEIGGLISYGPNVRENYRLAAKYIDKIFKGANPGELPIEQPTTFELFVNMKTAKALGIKVPQTILIQATKVIE